jgi:hypothetical protein
MIYGFGGHNSTNINRTNNHLKPLNTKKDLNISWAHGIGNPVSGWGQKQKSGRLVPIGF